MGNELPNAKSPTVADNIAKKETKKVTNRAVLTKLHESDDDEEKVKEYALILKSKPESGIVAFNEAKSKFIGMADIEAPVFDNALRAAVDIVCVLDTSGSMSGERISLLRKSVRRLVRGVNSRDRLALIEFNSVCRVLMNFTLMIDKGKRKAKDIINTIGSWGGTNLSGGVLEGLKLVKNRDPETANEVCSILLFTDGEANYGIRESDLIIQAAEEAAGMQKIKKKPIGDPVKWSVDDVCQWLRCIELDLPKLLEQVKEMKIDGQILTHDLTEEMLEEDLSVSRIHRSKFLREIEKLRAGEEEEKESPPPPLSCTINTFGYGSSHNSDLLEKMAERFDGMYYYVKDSGAINEGFATCLGGLMSTVATNLQLSLTPLNGAKDIKVLSNFPNTVKNTSVTINIGEIQSEEHRHILFQIDLPKANTSSAEESYCSIKLTYENAISSRTDIVLDQMRVERGKVTTERDQLVDVQYNRVVAAEALSLADELGKVGELERARTTLDTAFQSVQRSMSCRMGMSRNLMQDMEQTRRGYTNINEYNRWGKNYTKQNKACYRKERAVKVKDTLGLYSTQSQYISLSRMETVSAFDESCSDDSDAGPVTELRLTRAVSCRIPSKKAATRQQKRKSLRRLREPLVAPLIPKDALCADELLISGMNVGKISEDIEQKFELKCEPTENSFSGDDSDVKINKKSFAAPQL